MLSQKSSEKNEGYRRRKNKTAFFSKNRLLFQNLSAHNKSELAGSRKKKRMNGLFWLAPIAGITALWFAARFYKEMLRESEGNDTMRSIAGYVREGAMAYLKQQYKVKTQPPPPRQRQTSRRGRKTPIPPRHLGEIPERDLSLLYLFIPPRRHHHRPTRLLGQHDQL